MSDCLDKCPAIKKHPFKIIAFDWDGTAVENRMVDARPVAEILNELMKFGVYIVVITGTNFGNIDRQFCSLIKGPEKQFLYVCTDRGSEVYGFDVNSEPLKLFKRVATDKENALLDNVAEAVKHEIEAHSNVNIEIIYNRLNRRKIDLIPEWENPPKSQIGELLEKTEERLKKGGFEGGLRAAFDLAFKYAKELGLNDARITSDVKHIEVGLTDKSDSIKWILEELAKKRNIPFEDILILGDEFGPIAGFEGSDFRMYLPDVAGITYVSVGKEPNGVPPGVIHVGGGPSCFAEMMKEQVELYKKLNLTSDSTFILNEEGYEPLREREIESLFTVGNGYLGTRGSLAERTPESEPATLLAGIYDRPKPNAIEELSIIPDWLYTRICIDGVQISLEDERSIIEHRRILDMKRGILRREWRHRGEHGRITTIKFLHFASLAEPHAMLMRISVVPENYRGEIRVETGLQMAQKAGLTSKPVELRTLKDNEGVLMVTKTRYTGYTIAQAQISRVAPGAVRQFYRTFINKTGVSEDWRWQANPGQVIEIDKFVSIYTSRDVGDPIKSASSSVYDYAARGFDEMLLEQVNTWQERWDVAAIKIEDDAEAQRWANFACYHLIIAGNPFDERVSISARTLTGTIYKGHIFWDADMFMLPFFIYTHPPTAKAMLMYRYHTLPGARKEAQELGLKGALFAWESTITGEEMTPEYVVAPTGEVILILTGKMEQHINAAVAYGTWQYWIATNDDEFFTNAGAEILIETARFWVSRVEKDEEGIYHILNIEGPDEYHEIVNDNMYTNMMAAWNIDRAIDAIRYMREAHPQAWARLKEKIEFDYLEMDAWEDVSRNMYRNMKGRLIEQFEGYFDLNDINVYDYEERTGALDTILGRDAIASSQAVKQADVVMLLYLLENEFSEEVIKENFEYYERRTGHGSSLSPSIYGLVAARLGLTTLALSYLHQAGTIDLSNNMGNAAGGVHAAALGGLWQQFIMGFVGLRNEVEGLYIYPKLPMLWKRIKFTLLWHGNRLDFDIERDKQITITVGDKGEAKVGIFKKTIQVLSRGGVYVSSWDGSTWREFTEAGQKGAA
ncbi:MAG: glycoside hydrolase family 65 [Firmicutes bacterium]|nr:glycoside hydrolase family 65 [Bacillota bacterium]